jgi:signal transduction histidine kinase
MNRLWVRLSLAFGGVLVVSALGTLALVAWRAGGGASSREPALRELARALALQHARQGWDGVELLLDTAARMGANEGRPPLDLELVDAEGRRLYRTRLAGSGASGPGATEIGAAGASASGSGAPSGLLREIEILAVGGDAAGNLGWLRLYSGGRPPASADDRLVRDLRRLVLLGGLLGLLASVLISRGLAAPLARLAEVARAATAGDLSQRAEVAGADELRLLAGSFNEMLDALEEGEALRRNMVGDIAHELRTPLAALIGNLEALQDGVLPLEPQAVDRMHGQAQLLARLVEDLRLLSLAEAGQLPLSIQALDLEALAWRVVEAFAAAARARRIALSLEPWVNASAAGDSRAEDFGAEDSGARDAGAEAAQIMALADPLRLEQVLGSLVENALKYTPEGGRIGITAGWAAEPSGMAEPTGAVERPKSGFNRVWIEVSDSGSGITTEQLPHVFERFWRADAARDRASGGSGLGLAIARAIVEAQGGRISVASEGRPGLGSRFRIELPEALD